VFPRPICPRSDWTSLPETLSGASVERVFCICRRCHREDAGSMSCPQYRSSALLRRRHRRSRRRLRGGRLCGWMLRKRWSG